MTFTFAGNLAIDRDFTRFHTGDTVEERSFLSDEVIASLVVSEGSKEKAVIAGIEYIIQQLSQPDFKADWLSVSNGEAIKAHERMLATKKRKFGVGGLTAGVVYTYRADSDMEDPN